MKFAKRYRLTPYDRARQQTLFDNPNLSEPDLFPLTFGDPLPGSHGTQGVLTEHGAVVWRCAHQHRSTEGAVACAWRERGVRIATPEDRES